MNPSKRGQIASREHILLCTRLLFPLLSVGQLLASLFPFCCALVCFPLLSVDSTTRTCVRALSTFLFSAFTSCLLLAADGGCNMCHIAARGTTCTFRPISEHPFLAIYLMLACLIDLVRRTTIQDRSIMLDHALKDWASGACVNSQ